MKVEKDSSEAEKCINYDYANGISDHHQDEKPINHPLVSHKGFKHLDSVESAPITPDSDYSATKKKSVTRLYKRRWMMVALFAIYSASNAMQWIHLNIISNIIMKYYNVSLPGDEYQKQLGIDWLSMIYMLAYIPLIFPATWLLDKRGLRVVALFGTLLNAVGAWIKCGAVAPERFGVLMFAQTICAIAQIFILGIPARLAAVWFGPNEVSTATSLGVFGNQVGCAIGFLIPPWIVPNSDNLDEIGNNLSYMFYGTAAVTSGLFILVCIVFKKEPPHPPSLAQVAAVEAATHEDYKASLLRLLKNSNFLLLTLTYGINTGCYYAIGTLLNPIVLFYFENEEQNVGRIGLTLVLAGILGSIIAGIWLDKSKKYKETTVAIYFLSMAGMAAFTGILHVKLLWLVFIVAGMLGFFMTGYLPVGFEFAAELTFPESEGTSSGLLNASAQLFGIALTLSVSWLNQTVGILAGNLTLSIALLLGTILTAIIKSDLRRQKAGQQDTWEGEHEKLCSNDARV
ncbi:choline/ethanolamine transporter flvcr2a-like isoform X2 [Tubulanus polymorphus]|uniref:choline/ethanolamine transporter flvcr2a-like isoform X2 n=1 Tax=Tubulanus polymorphus TaxID=672921 RepID=UPI003DA5CDF2